ncbi:MAG: class I SAM-dependent methyltransferase [Nocardioides sp.]
MDPAVAEWLTTEPGLRAVTVAGELALVEPDPIRLSAAFRRQCPGLDGAEAAAAVTQAHLRTKARAKFGDDAALMLFTSEALEQATRARVAAHRAARLAAARVDSVVDLGCAIGGDLIAFARAGLVAAGVDLDETRVILARYNLRALGLDGAVTVADATTVDRSPFGAAFCDPARRDGRGRSFDANVWSPPWPFVEGLLKEAACIKTAPGIPHSLVPDGVEAEWVSDHGEVKEAALWSRPLATVSRRATVIGDGGLATLTDEDDPGADVRPLGRFVYEPDGAVIRAGLVTAVAAGTQGGLLDAKIAYVTSDAAFLTPFARAYEVLEELPFREKHLKAALRARGIGILTIKKRGVDVVPEQLRKRLALSGDQEATLVLTRIAATGAALLVRPL